MTFNNMPEFSAKNKAYIIGFVIKIRRYCSCIVLFSYRISKTMKERAPIKYLAS